MVNKAKRDDAVKKAKREWIVGEQSHITGKPESILADMTSKYLLDIKKKVRQSDIEIDKLGEIAELLAKTTVAKKLTIAQRDEGYIPRFSEQTVKELLKTLSKNPAGISRQIDRDHQILLRETIRRKIGEGRRLAWDDLTPNQKERVVNEMTNHALVDNIIADPENFAYWFGRACQEAKKA